MSKKTKAAKALDVAEEIHAAVTRATEVREKALDQHAQLSELQSRTVDALERIADTLATVAKQQRRSRRLKRGEPEKVTVEPMDWDVEVTELPDVEPPVTSKTSG